MAATVNRHLQRCLDSYLTKLQTANLQANLQKHQQQTQGSNNLQSQLAQTAKILLTTNYCDEWRLQTFVEVERFKQIWQVQFPNEFDLRKSVELKLN